MPNDPVQVEELVDVILKAIANNFKDRPLDIRTARMALSQAAFDLNMIEITAQVDAAIKRSNT